MSIPGFLFRNAFRNKRRLLLSVLSMAVSMFLLVTLMVVLRELTKPPTDQASALRVIVRNKISLAATLPARQRPIIEKTPGVEVCSPFVWFGGKFDENTQLAFGTIAMEPEKLPLLIPETKYDPAEFEAWKNDRTSCFVGRDSMATLAKERGLKVGDRFTLMSGIFPVTLELRIAGTYSGTVDDRNIWFHHKYLDEAMGNWGQTGMWWLKVTTPEVMPSVIENIEAAFANSSSEVRAESERAFQLSFVAMWGGIKVLVAGISSAVLISLLFVTASTMSMAIRERFRELAILKAIGFQRRELCAFILAESFGLAALGALLGAGGAWALYHFADMKKGTGGLFVSFEVTPQMLGSAALAAAVLGIASSLFPALSVARMSVVEGLKTLD